MPIRGKLICITNSIVWCSLGINRFDHSDVRPVSVPKLNVTLLEKPVSTTFKQTGKVAETKPAAEIITQVVRMSGLQRLRMGLTRMEPTMNFLSDVYLCTFAIRWYLYSANNF